MDSGANVHVCDDKKLFSLYHESSTHIVSMGNGSMTHVLREGQVKLELSLGNFPILDRVYHISNYFFVSPTRVQGCF